MDGHVEHLCANCGLTLQVREGQELEVAVRESDDSQPAYLIIGGSGSMRQIVHSCIFEAPVE